MLQIAICDDISVHSEHLLTLLAREDSISFEAKTFSSPGALLQSLEAQQSYDILFLDIGLREESGIALAKQINRLLPLAQIIFVTADIIHAVQIDEANHVYFLLKPVEPEKLHMALTRAVDRLRLQTDRRLSIPLSSGGDAFISVGSILYCERVLRLTNIFCTDSVLVTPWSLAALERLLPSLLFARPHNSYLVNLLHVARTDRENVFLDNGKTLSISNQRRAGFREALAAYVLH